MQKVSGDVDTGTPTIDSRSSEEESKEKADDGNKEITWIGQSVIARFEVEGSGWKMYKGLVVGTCDNTNLQEKKFIVQFDGMDGEHTFTYNDLVRLRKQNPFTDMPKKVYPQIPFPYRVKTKRGLSIQNLKLFLLL